MAAVTVCQDHFISWLANLTNIVSTMCSQGVMQHWKEGPCQENTLQELHEAELGR